MQMINEILCEIKFMKSTNVIKRIFYHHSKKLFDLNDVLFTLVNKHKVEERECMLSSVFVIIQVCKVHLVHLVTLFCLVHWFIKGVVNQFISNLTDFILQIKMKWVDTPLWRKELYQKRWQFFCVNLVIKST